MLCFFKALEWIHDQGEFYLSSNATIPDSEDEAKKRYEEHQKFTEMSEVHEVTAVIFYLGLPVFVHVRVDLTMPSSQQCHNHYYYDQYSSSVHQITSSILIGS